VQTCIWPSWCHCHSLSLASVKSRLVLPFWYRLTRVGPDKGAVKRVCDVCCRWCWKCVWCCYICSFCTWKLWSAKCNPRDMAGPYQPKWYFAKQVCFLVLFMHTHTHTHTSLTALCTGLPRWAGTGKVKPIRILLKQETVSGSGISWAISKFAPRSRQITTPAPHHSVFTSRMPFLPPNQCSE